MFDIGFPEMLIVGTVALIVVGPKDLPGMFRQVGQFVGKAKGMAREFSSAMNAAADEAGVNEINKTIKAAANPKKFGADKIREATGMASPDVEAKPETETDKLRTTMTEERKATAQKMNDAMAKAATDRQAADAQKTAPKNAPAKTATKTAAKTSAKSAASSSTAKTATAKAAPKAAAKKAAPAKTTAKKPAAKTTPKTAAKKTAAKPKTATAKPKAAAKDAK